MVPHAKRIPVIDGLRGLAVIGVIYHHLTEPSVRIGSVFTVLTNGWTGVLFFFVLSGLVLALPYARGERTLRTAADSTIFYKRRAYRLLPLYLFALAFSALFVVQPDARSMLAMLTFTFIFIPEYFFPFYNWVLWSLGVEAWMSLLFPYLWKPLDRLGEIPVLLVLTLLGIATGAAGHALLPEPAYIIVTNGVPAFLYMFVAGMLLARWHIRKTWTANGVLCAAGAALMLGCFLLLDQNRLGLIEDAYRPMILAVLIAGFCLCASYLLGHPQSALTRLISWNPLRWMGRMCYSLYVWHATLFILFQPAESWEGLLLFLAFLLPVSWVSFHVIEHPRVLWRLARAKNARGLPPFDPKGDPSGQAQGRSTFRILFPWEYRRTVNERSELNGEQAPPL